MLPVAFRIVSDNNIVVFKCLFVVDGYLLIANHSKPLSKEVVECLANDTFYIKKCVDIRERLGCALITLPDHLHFSRVIYTTGSNSPYTDNL